MLYAKWSMAVYTITATAGQNGSITPSGTTTINAGESQAYIIVANNGYEIENVLVDGSPVNVTGYYVFDNVMSNRTISVTFKEMVAETKSYYGLKKNINIKALITMVSPGTPVTIRYIPREGKTFNKWVVNVGGVVLSNPQNTEVTFIMPSNYVEITADVE